MLLTGGVLFGMRVRAVCGAECMLPCAVVMGVRACPTLCPAYALIK